MEKQKNLIIAISGKSGCGNTSVSTILAQRLGLRMINYTFRNMAADAGIPFEEFLKLAEGTLEYDRELDATQIAMAQEGDCVIGSRLAMWVIPEASLRVYLWASPSVRAGRIAKREGREFEDALARTNARDESDHGRFQKLYGIDSNAFTRADLIINTENFLPEQIASIIATALEQRLQQKKS